MDNNRSYFPLRKFPQNYILENPGRGSIIFFCIIFIFLLIYRPVEIHASQTLSIEGTIFLYSMISAGFNFVMIVGLRNFAADFMSAYGWNLAKEISSIVLLMIGLGSLIYLAAFIIEEPVDRLNLSTYMNSISRAGLVGMIPFLFFTALNLKYLFESTLYRSTDLISEQVNEKWLSIDTPLKKEKFGFYPSQFIYAEAQGNYLKATLYREEVTEEISIRCSFSGFEEQCKEVPSIMRVHRAFIVNLDQIQLAKGNSIGYRLTVGPGSDEIPVSRGYVARFRKSFGKS